MAGAASAIVALVASVTFGASLSTLVHRPRLYGWDWNATFVDGQGYGNVTLSKARAILDQDDHVAAWSGAYFGSDTIAGHDVPLLGMDPGSVVTPPMLEGRPIEHRSEAVLGGATAATLDKTIGDDITLADGGRPHVVRIVGIATLPTIGIVHGGRTSLVVGVIVAHQLVPGYDRDITNTKRGDFGPNAIFIRYRTGIHTRAENAKLRTSLGGTADFAGSDLLPTQRPAEIVNSSSIGNAPVLLAAALAVGAMVSLGLAIGTSVRRRHKDFMLLKTLGFTRRQLARTVSWQATTTIAVGLLIGIPLGIAVGRELWYLFAARLYVVPEPTVPVLALVGVAVAAVALANAVAAIPARAARRVNASPSSQTK
jgi:ABC-type antimicrobial peptide transport system permease subunit